MASHRPKVNARDGDREVLALAEGLVSALGKTFNAGDLETLRGVVESYPAIAGDTAGDVAASLSGLIDDLLARKQQDKAALAVHVRAWRYIVMAKPEPLEHARLMEGLHRVRRLYDRAAA